MPSATRLAPLVVALCLLLAGCGSAPSGGTATGPTGSTATAGGPSASTAGTATASRTGLGPTMRDTPGSGGESAQYTVTVENGSLPVDATLTFVRVQALLESDVEPWPVRVENLSEWRASVQRVGTSPLNRALGFENVSVDPSAPTGLTTFGTVYVHPGRGDAGTTERVLAHEFVHVVQYRTGMLPWMGRVNRSRLTTDRLTARQSLLEGGAVYVADAYTRQYLDVPTNSAYVRELYRSESPTHRSALAQYRFGAQYVAHRIDDPANLSRAYENYPRTTEQVIHNYSRAEEPPANLSVNATAASENWTARGRNTLGEMTTRTALGTELTRQRAAAAATGWGTDRLTVFQHAANDSRFGWAWVLRWDGAAEADELAAELGEYAAARDDGSPLDFRTASVDDRTVALVFGDHAFVDRASVTATDAGVSVSVGG